MAASGGNRLSNALRKYIFTGILVWLPLIVTFWVVTYLVNAADQLLRWLPKYWQPQYVLGFNIPGFGVIIAIVVLLITGIFAANVLGKKILRAWDSLLGRIPVIKSIYSSVKKVSESLFSENSRSFKTPVLVPFPQSNIWTIAFISGSLPDILDRALPEECVAVYVPTTPNPTGGYYIFVRRQDIRELDMTVDDALKYIISLGMVLPEQVAQEHELLSDVNRQAIHDDSQLK